MLDDIRIENILFLDIETVPQFPEFKDVPDRFKDLWTEKAKTFREEKTAEEVYARAGIYSEFGKIICISVGVVTERPERRLRLKSFSGDDEKAILENFFNLLNKHFCKTEHLLCAHNGKEFDFPYIARRGLINGLKIPVILDISGKKPWEIKHLDTMELWKFGDYKHYTSLNLLTAIFDIPSPKDDISGADVANVYYQEKNLSRIVHYCEKDVLSVVQLYLRYKGEQILPDDKIENVMV